MTTIDLRPDLALKLQETAKETNLSLDMLLDILLGIYQRNPRLETVLIEPDMNPLEGLAGIITKADTQKTDISMRVRQIMDESFGMHTNEEQS